MASSSAWLAGLGLAVAAAAQFLPRDEGHEGLSRYLDEHDAGRRSLAPEMKYRGGALQLFGREPATDAVNGLRPGTRSMTSMTHDLDKHLTTGWHEQERRQAAQRGRASQRHQAARERRQAVQRGALDQASCGVLLAVQAGRQLRPRRGAALHCGL